MCERELRQRCVERGREGDSEREREERGERGRGRGRERGERGRGERERDREREAGGGEGGSEISPLFYKMYCTTPRKVRDSNIQKPNPGGFQWYQGLFRAKTQAQPPNTPLPHKPTITLHYSPGATQSGMTRYTRMTLQQPTMQLTGYKLTMQLTGFKLTPL